MKSRQISLALFIKFDNRYRPPERQKHSAACHFEGSREYGGDPSKTAYQSFSQSDVKHPSPPPPSFYVMRLSYLSD